MNGKKRNNKKMVLDSDKVRQYLEVTLASYYFDINIFSLQKFNIHNFTFLKELKKNEFEILNCFQI